MGIGYTITEGNVEPGGEPRVLCRVGAQIGRGTNNQAEYEALLAGLRHALRLGLWDIQVKSDSLLVVNQMTGEWKAKDTKLAALLREGRVLAGLFNHFSIIHLRRGDNTAADALSRQIVYEEPDLGPTDMVRGKARAIHGWQAAAVLHWWHARDARSSYLLARIFNGTVFHQGIEAIVTGASYKDASFAGLPDYSGSVWMHETPAPRITDEEANRQHFLEHLEKASAEVRTWPAWKQNLLGGETPARLAPPPTPWPGAVVGRQCPDCDRDNGGNPA